MKLQIGIIGLGKFGLQLGKTLVDLGHEVLGVETNPEKVKKAQHVLTQPNFVRIIIKTRLTT